MNKNGRFVEIIREIGGSPHVLLEADVAKLGQEDASTDSEEEGQQVDNEAPANTTEPPPPAEPRLTSNPPTGQHSQPHKPIFVAHGKNKAPLQQLQALLTSFQIPHKVVLDEANLGRPISQRGARHTPGVRFGNSNLYARRAVRRQERSGNLETKRECRLRTRRHILSVRRSNRDFK